MTLPLPPPPRPPPPSPHAANCIPPSTSCVAGSYAVETPGGMGCLNCFDTNVAVGPMCNPGGTTGCNATQCFCSPQFTG